MLVAGLQKTSFVDFPGHPAAVVFTPYCNFNCVYCHNRHILGPETPLIAEEEALAFLEKRRGLLKAVVITGGEPTLQQNLAAFIEQARALSYLVKLDTNGTKPHVLQQLLHAGLLDYVAMDVKAPFDRYDEIAGAHAEVDAIRKSIALLRNGSVPHEFRLTFTPQLSVDDAVQTALAVKGCQRFFLQQYRMRDERDPAPHPPSVLHEACARIEAAIGCCTLRGA